LIQGSAHHHPNTWSPWRPPIQVADVDSAQGTSLGSRAP
jgi:hypothetical protein